MNKDELLQRLNLFDERAVNLFKKYPIVAVGVYLIGVVMGLGIGAWIWAF